MRGKVERWTSQTACKKKARLNDKYNTRRHSPPSDLVHDLHDPFNVIFGSASGLCTHRPRHHNTNKLAALVRVREAPDPKPPDGTAYSDWLTVAATLAKSGDGRSNEKMASDKRKRLVATPGTVFRCRITRTL